MAQNWLRLLFQCRNAEEYAHELIALGAWGVEILAPDQAACFLQTTEPAAFIDSAMHVGFLFLEAREYEPQNWVACCEQLWTPVHAGALTIQAVASAQADSEEDSKAGTIRIVAGSGFGTGDHPSTRMALELLQELPADFNAERILDVGTGSGILSIAACKLTSARITAIDFDSEALRNTRENIDLNRCQSRITLFHGELGDLQPFDADLIFANIYAEVLASLEPHFSKHLRPGGVLILAGILSEKRRIIEEAFRPNCWACLRERSEEQWLAFLLQRAA